MGDSLVYLHHYLQLYIPGEQSFLFTIFSDMFAAKQVYGKFAKIKIQV